MGEVLSVGMIGTGGIAQSHMQAIEANDNIRLAAVMDISSERVKASAAKYGGKAYMDLDDLLGDPDVEAVHVCTPHNLHVDHVVAAAEAGKHVMVEKPMALSVSEIGRAHV